MANVGGTRSSGREEAAVLPLSEAEVRLLELALLLELTGSVALPAGPEDMGAVVLLGEMIGADAIVMRDGRAIFLRS